MATKITRAGLQIVRSAMRLGTRKVKWETQSNPRDQFGRLYTVFLDRANLHPKGQFIREFSENLPVPDQYLSIPEGQPWLVEIDFKGWYRDEAAAMDDWRRREREARIRMYGNAGYERAPDTESKRIAGPRPLPKELIALMAAGDPWCLGLQREPTPAVLAVIDGDPELHERFILRRVQGSSTADSEVGDGELRLPKKILDLHRAGTPTAAGHPARRSSAPGATPARTPQTGSSAPRGATAPAAPAAPLDGDDPIDPEQ